MVTWRLKETMETHHVTRYAVQKQTGLARNTLGAMYDGVTRRPDLEVVGAVILGLRALTGKQIEIQDLLEWRG